jgi:hypothetical protein
MTRKPNLSALARKHGVSRESLRAWQAGGIDILNEAAVADRISTMREKPSNALAEARLEKLQAEISRIKHAHEVERGKYVPASQITAQGHQIGLAVRGSIERMTGDLTPRLAGRKASEVSKILKDYGRELLRKLSEIPSAITENLIEKS